MGYISIALRAVVNVESLNGIETVGNLSRHRTAPLVIPINGNGYAIRFLPVVSGESIAHAYQELLVEEANSNNLPLSERSKKYEFLKFAEDKLLEEENIEKPKDENDIRRAEVDILLKDFVCDVGGFLYAGNPSIKRTSCFQVGYMVPAIYEKEVAALESQFHMRFAPSSMSNHQMPYSVEVGSALYTFTFTLDTDRIGKPSTPFGKKSDKEEELNRQRGLRVKASLSALTKFYSYLNFGAKRSRFLPNMEVESAIASYSKDSRFTVSPGNNKEFIRSTAMRMNAFIATMQSLNRNASINLFAYSRDNIALDISGINSASSIEDMMRALINSVISEELQDRTERP
jgi:CRISPR-associated regulatory protein, Csa2 family